MLIDEKLQALAWWRITQNQKLARVKRRLGSISSIFRDPSISDGEKVNDLGEVLRKLHDLWGYMAKGDLKSGGLCSGALYRTGKFIKTPQEMRSGKKLDEYGKVRIHIEHTVPIKGLATELLKQYYLNQFNNHNSSAIDHVLLYKWLIKYSVTVAMVHGQEYKGGFIKNGYSSRTDAFDIDHEDLNYPFRRYQVFNDEIFNVIDGARIDLNKYTFDDHLKSLICLFGQYGGVSFSQYLNSI